MMSRPFMNTQKEYGIISLYFHWIVVFFIVLLPTLVFVGEIMPSMIRNYMVASHKILGVLFFFIASARLIWKFCDNRVKPLPSTPKWQHRAAVTVHFLLMIFTVITPLSGWLMVSAFRGPIDVFGFFSIPAITGIDPVFGRAMLGLHELCFGIIVFLLFMHIGAALFHHYCLKDATVIRMLPIGLPKIRLIDLFCEKKQVQKIIQFPNKFKK